MPWPFVSSGGCLFSGLAWIGILFSVVYAAASSAVSAIGKSKRLSVTLRVLGWTMALVSTFFVFSTLNTIVDIRDELAKSGSITSGATISEAYKYLPEYKYEGFYQFPTTAEVNVMVQELRIATAIWLISVVVSIGFLAAYLVKMGTGDPTAKDQKVNPITVMGVGGLLVVIVHLAFGVMSLSAALQ